MNIPKIINPLNSIETIVLPQKQGIITRNYRDDIIGVQTITLNKDCDIKLNPSQSMEGIETYQIISGCLKNKETHQVYSEGDIIILSKDELPISAEVIEEATILAYSYNENPFEINEENYAYLLETMQSIQKIDEYTDVHCKEVSDIVKEVARFLGWRGNRFFDLVLAARYHDIGSIYTPVEILTKDGLLTPEEFEIVKRHAVEGVSLLEPYFNNAVSVMVMQHHERLDGSGYPYGLHGDQMLEESKLLAVVDSFHAMCYARPYKEAMSPENALKELYELTMTKYDIRYVDVLAKLYLRKR